MSDGLGPPIPLIIAKSAYDSVGGPESLLQIMADGLNRNRFPPHLALLARPEHDLPSVLAKVAAQMPTTRVDWKGLTGVLTASRDLAALVTHPGALLHTNDMRANLLAWMIRRVRRVPWIAHVHGWLGPTHSGRHRLFEDIDRRLVRFADLVLVGSTAMRDEVRRAGARRVEIVTNGVSPANPAEHMAEGARIRASIAPRGRLIAGVLGRLHPGKGQALLLEAVAELSNKGIDIMAAIVGAGPAETEYRARARELGLGERVHFAGLVPDVRPWLQAMDMLCVPSLKDSMPLSAMEAMSLGLPVIASRTGELPIAIRHGHSGLIVDVGSVPSLMAAIERLALSPVERALFGAAGRQRLIEDYSPEAMLRQFEGFCTQVARGETARAR